MQTTDFLHISKPPELVDWLKNLLQRLAVHVKSYPRDELPQTVPSRSDLEWTMWSTEVCPQYSFVGGATTSIAGISFVAAQDSDVFRRGGEYATPCPNTEGCQTVICSRPCVTAFSEECSAAEFCVAQNLGRKSTHYALIHVVSVVLLSTINSGTRLGSLYHWGTQMQG